MTGDWRKLTNDNQTCQRQSPSTSKNLRNTVHGQRICGNTFKFPIVGMEMESTVNGLAEQLRIPLCGDVHGVHGQRICATTSYSVGKKKREPFFWVNFHLALRELFACAARTNWQCPPRASNCRLLICAMCSLALGKVFACAAQGVESLWARCSLAQHKVLTRFGRGANLRSATAHIQKRKCMILIS